MPTGGSGDGIGAKLREARLRRGMSLAQIAAATKISVASLEALERNDIARLPGGIFSRAFVRGFAAQVGLDPEEAIAEFIAQFPHDSVVAGHPISDPIEDREAIESERRMASTFLRMILYSVPIVGVVLYLGTIERAAGPEPEDPAAVVDVREGSAARATTVETEPAAARESAIVRAGAGAVAPPGVAVLPAADAGQRLQIRLTASARCWVEAAVDGRSALARELAAGEEELLVASREIVLTAGNAGGLALSVNGASTGPLGQTGRVVTLRLTPSNFKQMLNLP